MLTCAYCGRIGRRGFTLRFGDGRAPQTGDWACANAAACAKRQESRSGQKRANARRHGRVCAPTTATREQYNNVGTRVRVRETRELEPFSGMAGTVTWTGFFHGVGRACNVLFDQKSLRSAVFAATELEIISSENLTDDTD